MGAEEETPDANIQEEDVLAYLQLMDEIDPLTGQVIEKESFLTQLKKKGIIERKTAFFDPIGYDNLTEEGSGVGQLTLGLDFDLKLFESRNRSEIKDFIPQKVSFVNEKDKDQWEIGIGLISFELRLFEIFFNETMND